MKNFDTLFLDRDGVINQKLEGKYVRDFSEFIFIPGSLRAISELTSLFNRIIIITNQQGIAKGIMSESELHILHKKMQVEIENSGGKITKIYYCPHWQNANCKCRKPQPGMITNALVDFPDINIKNSYLVGDSDSDIEAGIKMNLITVKVSEDFSLINWTNELNQMI